jgi:hypothetical protein
VGIATDEDRDAYDVYASGDAGMHVPVAAAGSQSATSVLPGCREPELDRVCSGKDWIRRTVCAGAAPRYALFDELQIESDAHAVYKDDALVNQLLRGGFVLGERLQRF